MKWVNVGKLKSESDAGYLVTANRVDGKWVYFASGPKRKAIKQGRIVLGYEDPLLGYMPFKAHYMKGEVIPTERKHLGCFREVNYGAAALAVQAAVDACEYHYAKWGGHYGHKSKID